MKCITYCDRCNKETKNDGTKEQLLSDKNLVPQHKKYCKFCKMNYDVSFSSDYTSKQHFTSEVHKKQERFDFYFS